MHDVMMMVYKINRARLRCKIYMYMKQKRRIRANRDVAKPHDTVEDNKQLSHTVLTISKSAERKRWEGGG